MNLNTTWNFKFTIRKIIAALVVWQFISVGLMAVGTWPIKFALINTALIAIFILFAKPYYSMLLLVLSIPFYVILPNKFLPDLPMWRVLFVWAFVVWFVHLLINQRQWLMRVFQIKRWNATQAMTGARLWEIIINAIKRIDSRFMPWDKVAVLFVGLAALSLLIARFPVHGFKQILFLLNVYLFYVVVINVTTDQEKVKELVRYVTYSLGIMVALGYVQYIATMFTQPYYFWQYWAALVSSLYYGNPLGQVLAYSNSWFSYTGGAQSLRMFGILPDTHAFGVMCIFLLAYLVPHLNFSGAWNKLGSQIKNHKWYLLVAIILVSFGIIADGTRGVWIAMLAPFALVLLIHTKGLLHTFTKPLLIVFALIIVMFAASPFITKGLNYIRTNHENDNFLSRASSIYDLSESSNAGRLAIWKSSVKFAAVHPFGVGYGNFIVSVINDIPDNATYDQVSAQNNLRYNLPEKFITAHSLYLQLLVEMGFAGLLAFILFWWEYFERLIDYLEKHKIGFGQYAFLTFSLAMAFVWILAYGVFDLTILNDRVLQYLFLSLAISGLIFAKFPVGPNEQTGNSAIMEKN